jgi:hypothetical protein
MASMHKLGLYPQQVGDKKARMQCVKVCPQFIPPPVDPQQAKGCHVASMRQELLCKKC